MEEMGAHATYTATQELRGGNGARPHLAHSPFIPASLMTLSHLFCSETISWPNSAELIFTTAPPCSASFFWKPGWEMTSIVSRWKRATMSAGVFGGAKMPHQMLDS